MDSTTRGTGPVRRRPPELGRMRRGAAALTGAAAALFVGLAAPPGDASEPTPPPAAIASTATANNGDSVARLHQEVRQGTLLDGHGVKRVCPLCQAEVVTTVKNGQTPLTSADPAGYGPADLGALYALPTAPSGSTRTIAVIDAGVDPALAHDLAAYRTRYGLPACTVASGCLRLRDYTGGAQPAPQRSRQGASIEEQVGVETSLDVDMASAACPTCRLLEISVPWQDAQDDNDVSTADFAHAVRTAVAEHASAVSISYGYTADVTNTSGPVLKALTRKGVAVTASSGDLGFNGGIHQLWPSDLPSVISAGGVTLPASGPASAWTFSGSGCETHFASAAGQSAAATRACGGRRAGTDISADADPATGVAVYDTYAPSSGEPDNWLIAGGTSAAAPYLAGLFARAGHLGQVDGPRTLYGDHGDDFTDITRGNNELYHQCSSYPSLSPSVCTSGTAWDGPTGLGVPHGLGAF